MQCILLIIHLSSVTPCTGRVHGGFRDIYSVQVGYHLAQIRVYNNLLKEDFSQHGHQKFQ